MLPIAHWPVRVQGIREDMPSNMLSFINFELLELYWTYFWPSKPRLSKFLKWDSWAWIMSRKWDVMPWAWTMGFDNIILPWVLDHGLQRHFVNMALLGFKRGFLKIHDNVDVMRVANKMKPCDVKNLPLTSS